MVKSGPNPLRGEKYFPEPPYNIQMSLVQDRCICLRKVEYSETSQILLLFTRTHGLVRVIAKGAHRTTKAGASKFGGGVDLLDVAQAVFTNRPEKDLATLTEWTLREGHPDLRKSLRGLYLGFYAAEMVAMLIEEHDAHPDLFDHLETVLEHLGRPGAEQAFLAFELRLLRETGYLPHLAACVSCGASIANSDSAWFSPARGGVLCRNCEAAFPDRRAIDRRLIDLLQYILRLTESNGHLPRLPKLTRHQTDPINRLLIDHIQHTLSRRMRTAKYIL